MVLRIIVDHLNTWCASWNNLTISVLQADQYKVDAQHQYTTTSQDNSQITNKQDIWAQSKREKVYKEFLVLSYNTRNSFLVELKIRTSNRHGVNKVYRSFVEHPVRLKPRGRVNAQLTLVIWSQLLQGVNMYRWKTLTIQRVTGYAS